MCSGRRCHGASQAGECWWVLGGWVQPVFARFCMKVADFVGFDGSRQIWAMFRKPQPLQLVLQSRAVHLQFVRQYAPHLYRRTFLASKLRRKGNPAIRLPFVLQYASHLYGSTPPICTAILWRNTGGWGHRNVSEDLGHCRIQNRIVRRAVC